MATDSGKIVLHMSGNLAEIVPGYLENRRKDLPLLVKMLEQKEFESLRIHGHRLKGSGGGYGFSAITDIGHTLETAAKNKQQADVAACIATLDAYLKRIEVTYDLKA